MRDIAFAVNYSIRQLGGHLLLEVVGQLLHMGVILVKVRHTDLARLGERGDIRHGLGAWRMPRPDRHRTSAEAGAGPFTYSAPMPLGAPILGPETLIRSQFHFFRRQAYTAKSLYGINMEQRFGCLGLEQLSELFDQLYRADLVVDQLAERRMGVLGQCFAPAPRA